MARLVVTAYLFLSLYSPTQMMYYIRNNIMWDMEREQEPAQTPLETLELETGVCRDIAVLAGFWLEENRYEPQQIVFGLWMPGYDSHEGVIYEQDGKLCFIDNYNLQCGFENVNEIVEYVRRSQGVVRVCNWHLREWDNRGPVEIWC